jgi:molybdate transport system substrate-binding protein
MKTRSTLAAFLVLGVAVLGGCGDDDSSTNSARTDASPLVISAAASLKGAFTQYAGEFGNRKVALSFAGSDVLATQIKQGIRPDVFASANTKLPDELYAAGLVGKPTVFAGNRLVLAVPADSEITSLEDLQKSGVKLAIGSDSVPVGAYTRKVLGGLPAGEQKAILGNVRSEEPDVKGVVGKLTQGAVDAGFVYITDVNATKGALKAIELPQSLKPSGAYGAAVVKGAKHPEEAQEFIDGLISGDGQKALQAAGFEPPPGE